MFCHSLLHRPPCLSYVHLLTVHTRYHIDHTFLLLVSDAVLHMDQGLSECVGGLEDCLDAQGATNLLDLLTEAVYVRKENYLLPLFLNCRRGRCGSIPMNGTIQDSLQGRLRKAIGPEKLLQMLNLLTLRSVMTHLVSSVFQAFDHS